MRFMSTSLVFISSKLYFHLMSHSLYNYEFFIITIWLYILQTLKKNCSECVTNTGVKVMDTDDLVVLFRALLLNRKFLCSGASQMWQMCPLSLYFLYTTKVVHFLVWYIFVFMITYHFLKVRTPCCLLHYPQMLCHPRRTKDSNVYSFAMFVYEGHAFLTTCRNFWHFTVQSFFKV